MINDRNRFVGNLKLSGQIASVYSIVAKAQRLILTSTPSSRTVRTGRYLGSKHCLVWFLNIGPVKMFGRDKKKLR